MSALRFHGDTTAAEVHVSDDAKPRLRLRDQLQMTADVIASSTEVVEAYDALVTAGAAEHDPDSMLARWAAADTLEQLQHQIRELVGDPT